MKDLEKLLDSSTDENLVMFPAAKNYAPDPEEVLDDPLNDLLNEFSEYEDEDFVDYYEDEQLEAQALDEAKALVDSFNGNQSLGLFERMNQKVDRLEESTKRVRFYLSELDFYIDKR